MSFQIDGPDRSAIIDSSDEGLFELAARYSLHTPLVDRIWELFYDSPSIAPAQVPELRAELTAIREAHRCQRRDALRRERGVRAKDEAVANRILEPMLAGEPWLRKLDELIALCDDAIAQRSGLTSSSD